MCGITGIIDRKQKVDRAEMTRFTDALSHRGPDGRGIFVDRTVGLGHRRLAILDLSEAGTNPMSYTAPDGNVYWITLNGEIYNFLELRRELEALGHHFHSQTDTEVALAAYAQWGRGCLERFNGMWAFAVWDAAKRELFLSRDRFGIKPLYYCANGRIAFASELKAFLSLTGFTARMNDPLVRRILQSSEPWEGVSDESMMEGVRALPAGHYMLINEKLKFELVRWWVTSDHVPPVPHRYEDQTQQFREILLDAVRLRMRSDVPVGTSLSGGLDSSAVASSMAWLHKHSSTNLERCASDWQKTFVATFPGSKLDERPFADTVARSINADVHYKTFDPVEAAALVQDVIWSVEYVHGIIAAPVWSIYREMRRNDVLVSLDGHGGDETLGGYAGYLDIPIGQLNEKLYADIHQLMLPSILRNYDRCSMAHGVEVRMPLLDWRLVTFACGLPPQAKIGSGFTKRILRDAVRGILTEPIRIRRSKIGFNAPMIEWFNGAMKPVVEAVLRLPFWNENSFWDGKDISTRVRKRMNAGPWRYEDWGQVFQLSVMMNVALWHALFVEQRRADLS